MPGGQSSILSAGFVLLPERPIREALHQRACKHLLSEGSGDLQLVPARRLLLPLLMIEGSAQGIQLGAVRAAAASVRCNPFQVVIDRVLFSPVGRQWALGLRQRPPGLTNLRTSLEHALSAQHASFPAQPWRPVIPLASTSPGPPDRTPRKIERLTWAVVEFSLVQIRLSRFGAVLETIDAWPLQA